MEMRRRDEPLALLWSKKSCLLSGVRSPMECLDVCLMVQRLWLQPVVLVVVAPRFMTTVFGHGWGWFGPDRPW